MLRANDHKRRFTSAALVAVAVAIFLAATFLTVRHSFSAGAKLALDRREIHPVEKERSLSGSLRPSATPQPAATRFKLDFEDTQDLRVENGVDSFVLVAPEIATVVKKNGFTLSVTGNKPGETTLIISYGSQRQVLVIEVTRRSRTAKNADTITVDDQAKPGAKTQGSVQTTYSHAFGQNPSVLRSTFDLRTKLSEDRTLHIAADTFKVIGNADRTQAIATVPNFGFNRLGAEVETPTRSFSFLDSQVSVSHLTLNNYTVRGFQMTTKSKSGVNTGLDKKGLQIFAGLSRPSVEIFGSGLGKIAGIIVPIASGKSWQVRGGAIAAAPERDVHTTNSGLIGQWIGEFAPNKNFSSVGEVEFSKGELSGRVRSELKFKRFGASGEFIRFARSSPLNSIGAQAGGHASEVFSAYWRPVDRLSVSFSYNHTEIKRIATFHLSDFERSSILAAATWRIDRSSSLKFRYYSQDLETPIPGASTKFGIATKTIELGHNRRLNRNWSNSVDTRLNLSREADGNASLETGFSIDEQLRFSISQNTFTAFVNYNRKSPTLTNLIVRNPQLLPPALQEAFMLDPTAFLQTYRDRLHTLIPSIELPRSSNLDAGGRFQTNLSRVTLTGEARYTQGSLISTDQKSVYASVTADVRIDNANFVQIGGWKTFGPNSRSAVTFSYKHIFGSERGGGFKFSDLFGLNRGRVEGRVYYDLNANGRDDNEPGVARMVVRLGGDRTVTTDSDGRYRISTGEGSYNVALASDALGVRLRATSPTQYQIRIISGKVQTANFGLIDSGFIRGRVFNDLMLANAAWSPELPPISGIKIRLRSADSNVGLLLERVSDGTGSYDFSNLRPGKYILEVLPESLPANFRIPDIMTWEIQVEPLGAVYFDLALAAQRAISGIVYEDRNRNGRFDQNVDQPTEGASVISGNASTTSDSGGVYILRGLPAGNVKMFYQWKNGPLSPPIVLNMPQSPTIVKGINLPVR